MKKIIALSLILGVGITSVSNFSFAADAGDAQSEAAYCTTHSSICGTAPKDFTALFDFVTEMSNAIKTIGTKGSYLGQYVNPNRFKGNVFTPPKQSIVGRVARNASQKIKFALASTAIFSSPVNFGGLKDMLGGVVLLSKDKIFMRDNKIIEQIESHVNDKKYELGLGGGWYEQVNTENRALMQGIIDKYIAQGLFIGGSRVNEGVSYTNISSLLTKALTAAKSFLYFGSTSQFDEITRGGSDQGITIKFNDTAIQNIQREYACARGPNYICSSEHKSIKQILSSSFTSIGSSTAKKTFNDAVDRLGKLFAKDQSQAFKDREADLLRTMYGTQKVSNGLLFGNPGKVTSNVGKDVTTLASDISTFRTFPKDLKGTVDRSQSIKVDATTTTTINADDFVKAIDVYINDVFASQPSDKALVSIAEVKGVTPSFNVLGKQISAIKNNILGGKEKDNSLLKSLGAACELQCGRGGLCR